jgi:hypothetical protein
VVKRFILLVWLLVLPEWLLFSQQVEESSPAYSIGFSVFSGKDLEPESLYLVRSIPLLIKDRITICKSHMYSDEGITRYREYLIHQQVKSVEIKLEELYQQKDAHIFNPSRLEDQLEKLDENITLLTEKKTELEEIDPVSIEIENPKPIDYKRMNDSEELFPPTVLPLGIYTEIHGLDMLIGGTIEEVEGFFYIEVFAYSKIFDDFLYKKEDALSGDTLNRKILEISDELISVLLGRDWGNIVIDVTPPSADIYLDNIYLGTGTATQQLLDTGSHRLTLEAEGYRSYSRNIMLVPFTENRFSLTLEREMIPNIAITTYPQGADVYLASRWIGRTPIFLPKPELNTSLTLKKENFRDINIYNLGLDSTDLRAAFPSNRIDLGSYIDEKRDAVYGAMGFFALSIPFPVILYNLSNEYANILIEKQDDATMATAEKERLYLLSNVFYHSYVGTLFITASLFINSIVHLVQYLTAVASD